MTCLRTWRRRSDGALFEETGLRYSDDGEARVAELMLRPVERDGLFAGKSVGESEWVSVRAIRKHYERVEVLHGKGGEARP